MCNLYSLTSGQDAIREVARAMRDAAGNLPPCLFPDQSAPVVAMAAGERVLTRMRWACPRPASH